MKKLFVILGIIVTLSCYGQTKPYVSEYFRPDTLEVSYILYDSCAVKDKASTMDGYVIRNELLRTEIFLDTAMKPIPSNFFVWDYMIKE